MFTYVFTDYAESLTQHHLRFHQTQHSSTDLNHYSLTTSSYAVATLESQDLKLEGIWEIGRWIHLSKIILVNCRTLIRVCFPNIQFTVISITSYYLHAFHFFPLVLDTIFEFLFHNKLWSSPPESSNEGILWYQEHLFELHSNSLLQQGVEVVGEGRQRTGLGGKTHVIHLQLDEFIFNSSTS